MTSEQPSRHRVHGTKPELIATLARHHEHPMCRAEQSVGEVRNERPTTR